MHRAPANGILVTAFTNQIFGLDVASGQIRWEVVPPIGYGEIELAVEEGVVIAANSNVVTFIDYASGYVHAVVPIPGDYSRRPTMIVEGRSSRRFHVRRSDGMRTWCQSTPARVGQ